jgi:type 1 glutamine amidotransferase
MRTLILCIAMTATMGRAQPAASKSVRPSDSRRVRTSVAGLLGWKTALPAGASRNATFMEAAATADSLGLAFIEGFSDQKVSAQFPKNLDYHLSTDEVGAVKNRLAELKLKMPAYRVTTLGPDENGRKTFEFAKSLGVETIVADPEPASLAAIGKLANEFAINVATSARDPKTLATTLQNLDPRIGASVDLGVWAKQSVKAAAGLELLKDRLLVVNLDSSAANEADALQEMAHLMPPPQEEPDKCSNCSRKTGSVKTVVLTLDANAAAIDRFEKAVRPAMGYRISEDAKLIPITSVAHVPPEDRAKIEAALPKQAIVKPKKPRKMLVVDLCPAGGYYHATIAHANLAIELMAKSTGAYQAVFSNDLNNLKYPKIKEYDAVFLNSVVGEVFPDPDVLNGLLRFVREGGGVAGLHGATYASEDLAEYGEMMGAEDGPHHVEPAVLKVEDPSSPLTKSLLNSNLTKALGGREFAWTDEFYHFLPEGSYSREKLHILLSIDTSKSDMSQWHVRPDNDYGISWVRSYGKGRVFNCAIGHTPMLFETPEMAQFVLAAIQFVLGDLDADTTPSAKLSKK